MINFILILVFCCSIAYFIYIWTTGKKKYKEFVSFLKQEKDFETLEKIGARFHGEDLNSQMKVLKAPMEDRLLHMYEQTKKQEYIDYLEVVQNHTKKFLIAFFIVIFFGVVCYLIILK